MLRAKDGERGATVLEFVITMPLLLLFLMVAVQTGFTMHAQNAAQAAADEGAARARAFDGSATEGRSRAQGYLGRLAGPMFTSYNISARRSETVASVTVAAKVKSLIPGFHPEVSRTSAGPVERFVEEP
ncbi:hypothetical protein ASD11_14635 [Aeromicrobium sp. Root495]|uniref:TadE family protein n=1 Tax=Aeromicrobium sp. Root495 TaxID=1736550 RepID=UPI0006F6D91B|nr:TadE family protein [Aeromicrobium sp. Root495]KQY55746.1 hypothetical protein ASD11_14635 [Aeromicrobium sp. Root495]